MRAIIILVVVLTALHKGNSQIILCDLTWASCRQVTAKSGLKLRTAPSTAGKIIAVVPFQTEVKICLDNAKEDVIDGVRGKWVKAFWQEQQGYIFDGYLQACTTISTISFINPNMDLINDWKYNQYKTDELLGLFPTSNPREFNLRRIKLEKDGITGSFKPAQDEDTPLWFIEGLDQHKSIKGIVINRMIFIGEKIALDEGTIYADGILNKQNALSTADFTIDPYELKLHYFDGTHYVDHLLLLMRCNSGIYGRYRYEAQALLRFVGDLDGDTKNDILITYQCTYKGWHHVLFSTKYASDGAIYKEIIVGGVGS